MIQGAPPADITILRSSTPCTLDSLRIADHGYKSERRSRIATDGLDRTSHRAFLRACGLDDDDLDKPRVGIVSTQGENTPCSMSLGPQADAARLGVAAGGGVPVPFTTISISDGLSMNHKGMRLSLVSRELIADSIEAVMRGHAYDALVGFAGCDKTLPGIMMAMVRLNCPSVFVYGGAMLPGRWRGRDVTVLTAYEAVGSVLAGTMTEAELGELERACAPTVGSCPGQFTANTMAMVSEALGLALPGSAMLPAVYSERLGARAACGPARHRDPPQRRAAAARSRHPQVAGECIRRGGGNGRFDQRRSASAGHRARGRHPLHLGRFRARCSRARR